jgi:hypothetical protein
VSLVGPGERFTMLQSHVSLGGTLLTVITVAVAVAVAALVLAANRLDAAAFAAASAALCATMLLLVADDDRRTLAETVATVEAVFGVEVVDAADLPEAFTARLSPTGPLLRCSRTADGIHLVCSDADGTAALIPPARPVGRDSAP